MEDNVYKLNVFQMLKSFMVARTKKCPVINRGFFS